MCGYVFTCERVAMLWNQHFSIYCLLILVRIIIKYYLFIILVFNTKLLLIILLFGVNLFLVFRDPST